MRPALLASLFIFTTSEYHSIGNAAEKEVIRVLRQDSTLECDLDGTCKMVAHPPRHGIASPDGKWIVYQHQDNDDVRLFVAQADGSQKRKLTKREANESSPCWSPDGERIAYVSDLSGNEQIQVVNVDGSNHEQLTTHAQGAAHPKFGSDGSLAYLMWREPLGKLRLSDLVVIHGKKSNTVVRKQHVNEYVWSPDGKALAISKFGELMFHDIETGREQAIALKEINAALDHHVARCLTWNPSGDAVACRIEAMGGRIAGGSCAGRGRRGVHCVARGENAVVFDRQDASRDATQSGHFAAQPISDGTPMGPSLSRLTLPLDRAAGSPR